MQQGELTVTGHDHATIKLHSFPSQVECFFKDHVVIIPCNHHHHDELTFEVHHSNTSHGKFVLKIEWRVAGIRELVFKVSY